MSMRLRRLEADYQSVRERFGGHSHIAVEPVSGDPPEKYRVTYYVKGIYRQADGSIWELDKHVVEIVLHTEYPRFKPVCTILTPIWHPNFRDGQICIGDIWGAGESLADIIVNIGDMIQYKSWNAYSPLSADAARWAMENKHLFPIGGQGLYGREVDGRPESFDIDLLDEGESAQSAPQPELPPPVPEQPPVPAAPAVYDAAPAAWGAPGSAGNTLEITAEELAGIPFIPTAQHMHEVRSQLVENRKVNFKTVFKKGILYGLLGGLAAWIISELLKVDSEELFLRMAAGTDYSEEAYFAMYYVAILISTTVFSGIVGAVLGAALGMGEGLYYGSRDNAVRYAFIGLGAALVISAIGGALAQIMYTKMLPGDADFTNPDDLFALSFYRAVAWAAMGLATGFAAGLIKPAGKRILYCALGGMLGGFVGGFLFNYIDSVFSTEDGIVSRAFGIVIMGLLVGLGIGLLEQFAKSAWLKVTRGEFEGKEYLVFAGITSIGNSGKNTISLFKDRLVAPYHCQIRQMGGRYEIVDSGSATGTIVNGMRVERHVLRKGDTIALGNTVLVFQTK